MDVSDRRMQVQLTQEAKIVSDFYSIRAIFAFVGFVSALALPRQTRGSVFSHQRRHQREDDDQPQDIHDGGQ